MTDGADLPTIRDAAVVLFAYCLNGLRDSSVLSIKTFDVNLDNEKIIARLSVVKGKQASRQQLVRYDRLGDLPSPVDLWLRWHSCRTEHSRFFALGTDPVSSRPKTLTDALVSCLQPVEATAPPGGKYTSHSLMIGAHTEQVLLGIPLEVRLSHIGWGPRGQEMAALYIDRTITTSPASVWLFGASPLPPASSAFSS